MRVLMLSPHPDDIAWSIGGTVALLRSHGDELHVLTFFGQTLYAPGHASHGLPAATVVRGHEERAWGDYAGVQLDRRYLPDASLRGYTDDTEMGAPPEDDVVAAVAKTLVHTIQDIRPDLMFVPAAAGQHVDHTAVMRAADDWRSKVATVHYEDLPYAATTPPALGQPRRVDVTPWWAAKEVGLRFFESQLPSTFLPVLQAHTAAVVGERLWLQSQDAAEALRSRGVSS